MSKNRKAAVVSMAAIALVGAAAGGYVVTRGWPEPAASTAAPLSGIAASTAPEAGTGSDQEDGAAETKPAVVSANPESGQTLATDAPAPATGAAVPVKVSFYGWNAQQHQAMVGGYAVGIVESGGTCSLTLTKGGASVSAEVPATADASTTACGAVTVPGDRLGVGTWQAVLSYSSPSHTGAAAPVVVEVTP